MAYERLINHYNTDATTLIQVLDSSTATENRVLHAEFELLRQGGCGVGEVVLDDSFNLRDETGLTAVNIGEYISFDYDSNTRWYFGRVEEITQESPHRRRVRLHGLWAEINEVYPGGFGSGDELAPHRMAASDFNPNDPDALIQSFDIITQPEQIIALLYDYYIEPRTNVQLGGVQQPNPQSGLDTIVLRGEENAAAIIRGLATHMKSASFGVDQNRDLFVQQKRSTTLATFQEGVDCERLSAVTDRSLMFNRLLLTGGYVYGATHDVGFYRYRATFRQPTSITAHGERRARIFLPWIRRNDDATQFATEFFREYGSPTTRHTFTTNGQDTLLEPWTGRIKLLDKDGATLDTNQFERLRVEFNHVPIFSLTLGPEDIQFPSPIEDQRFEVPPTTEAARGDGQLQADITIPSLAPFDGTAASSA